MKSLSDSQWLRVVVCQGPESGPVVFSAAAASLARAVSPSLPLLGRHFLKVTTHLPNIILLRLRFS